MSSSMVPTSECRVTVVTVTYNSASVIEKMLQSVPDDVAIVVVDNASSDDTIDIVERLFNGVNYRQVVQLKQNLGFGTACNRGADLVTGEFVFFANPDSLVSDTCIDKLVEAATSLSSLGALNPTILTAIGKNAVSDRRYSKGLSKVKKTSSQSSVLKQVGTLSGSAMFFATDTFRQLGGFDERIFLFHEDDELCRRMTQSGLPMYVAADAELIHLGGQGAGKSKSEFAAQKSYLMAQARIYVEAKHGVNFWRLRAYFRAFWKFASLYVPFSARKRAQAVAHFRGTWAFDLKTYGTAND